MRNRPSKSLVIAVLLFVVVCVLGAFSQTRQVPQIEAPRAQYSDATPLGGKGLRLLLERLNYRTKLQTGVLQSVPSDAKVWIILDPETGFSNREATALLKWVKGGGTLIWASAPMQPFSVSSGGARDPAWADNVGIGKLQEELKVSQNGNIDSVATFRDMAEPLPPLSPLKPGSVNEVWSGVKKAQGSSSGLEINRAHLLLAASPVDAQFAQIPYGKGRVFVAPDALIFTNYALSKADNAVLVSNLIRLHAPNGSAIYFDERQHGEELAAKIEANWLYYIWRPPLRYAVIQLFLAAILAAILYGRRLGAPVPLPDSGPITRASQFASAMGALFQKVGRPRAAGVIIGEHFRRKLTRRLGLSIEDDDELIAQKAAEATGFPSRMIDRLLLQAKAPDDDEARTLSDAQEMEMILRKLEQRES